MSRAVENHRGAARLQEAPSYNETSPDSNPSAPLPGWNATRWGWIYVLSLKPDGSGIKEHLWIDRMSDDLWSYGFTDAEKGSTRCFISSGVDPSGVMRLAFRWYETEIAHAVLDPE